MPVLILEPSGYSPRALESYRMLGPVWLEKPPAGMEASVTVLVVRLAYTIDGGFLSTYPGAAAIVSPTTGLTHIDLNACRQRGVRVFSLAECREAIEDVTSTSELALGLIIALLRRIPQAHHEVTVHGRWDRDSFRSRQLSRLTLGVVGLGRIGGHVAGYARAMGMRVIACDPHQEASRFTRLNVEQSDLAGLLEKADIVSLHASLSEDTAGLLGASEIALMRTGALLVNTARGALLDEAAVAASLRSGKLGGAALDVLTLEHEAAPWTDSPLVSAARDGYNVILTPHIGGCTADAMHITEERLAEVVVRTLEKTS